MICTSIQGRNLEEIWALLQGGEIEMAEIRLDLCPLSLDDITELFSATDLPLVATCRSKNWSKADVEKLLTAIVAGARFADVDVEAPAAVRRKVRDACQEYGTSLIVSYHNEKETPAEVVLRSYAERCHDAGAEIVKMVTTAQTQADVDRILWLYRDKPSRARLIAFAMGEAGRKSRLDCLRKGAPFTYAAPAAGEETAPGQWTTAEMREAVYSKTNTPDFVTELAKNGNSSANSAVFVTELPLHPAAPIAMPASKSFAQRAILCAALAEGTSHLSGYTPCGDSEAAMGVAEALGATVRRDGETLSITGIAAVPGCLHLPEAGVAEVSESPAVCKDRPCDGAAGVGSPGLSGASARRLEAEDARSESGMTIRTGESGLLTRLLIPLLAVLADGPVRVTGEKTLLGRPLANAHDYMAAFGARLQPEEHFDAARPFDCYLPLTVRGPLIPGRAELSGKGGSQMLSGLLTALPLCDGDSRLYVTEPRSIPYLFITLDVLKRFGVVIGSEMEGDERFMETQDWTYCTGLNFKIKGGQRLRAADFRIEGDWSGAANFLVAGAVFGEVEVSGLDADSLQADLTILDILTDAGAGISRIEEGDNAGNIHVVRAPLNAFEADLNHCPDLFPIVAVLAAFCPGRSRIFGTDRLAHKETDRAAAIVEMLKQMGVPASIEDDCLTVGGQTLVRRLLRRQLLHGGRYSSYGDHRLAMALRVASLGADSPIDIDDSDCVAKSFPTFPALFRAFAAGSG